MCSLLEKERKERCPGVMRAERRERIKSEPGNVQSYSYVFYITANRRNRALDAAGLSSLGGACSVVLRSGEELSSV